MIRQFSVFYPGALEAAKISHEDYIYILLIQNSWDCLLEDKETGEEWLKNPLITKRITKIANLIDEPVDLIGIYTNMQKIYKGKWDQDLI